VAFPTIFTKTLAGIWHGAGVNYVIYGVLHGMYLTINHAWRIFGPGKARKKKGAQEHWLAGAASVALTYLAVLVALVFFRAPREDGFGMLGGMIGLRGWTYGTLPAADMWEVSSLMDPTTWAMMFVCFIIVFFAPNLTEIFAKYDPIIGRVRTSLPAAKQWTPNLAWGTATGVVAALCVLFLAGATEFLYFQF
jgi:hypothetical protein